MRIVLIAAEEELPAGGLSRAAGVDLWRVHPDEVLRHRERLESAAAVVLAVPPPLERGLLPRVRDLAPGAARIVLRGAGEGSDPEEALACGADEIVLAETLEDGLAAAEIRRAVRSARARRKWATEAPARRSEEIELFRVIFENDVMAVSLNELTGPYVAVNDVWVAETGYTREEVIGRTPAELAVWAEPGQLRTAVAELRRRGRVQIEEMRLRTRGGAEKICRVGLGLAEFRGRPHVVGFSRDVTEERWLARELVHAQKMEAVGRLAAGVAHDFNNLLTVIQMAAFFAHRAVGEDGPLRDSIEEIEQAGRRGATLVRALLAFARCEIVRPRLVDLDEIVRDLENLMRRVVGERIAVVSRLHGPTRVYIDPGQIEQILMNLALNARDAMSGVGHLTVETERDDSGHGFPEPNAGFVRLTVRDTGCGIPADVRDRVFEPFFTTKPFGEGTGLGLFSVRRIVSEAGGRIAVESEPGRGTAFHVFLPRREEGSKAN